MDPRFPFSALPKLPLFLFFFFAFFLCPSQASVFTVGDSKGWVVGIVNYTLWASNHTFYVGDYLVFNYVPEFHSVMEVSKDSYDKCEARNVIAQHSDGNTVAHLEKEGTYYYICGTEKHCPLGQKLEVRVFQQPSPSIQKMKNSTTSMVPAPAPSLSLLSASNSSALQQHSSPFSSSSMRYQRPFSLLLLLHIFLFFYRQL